MLRVEMLRVETRVRCGLSGVGALHRVASPPEKRFMTLRKHRGFSLLELLITVAIGLTMAGITFIAMMPLFKQNHVDAAYDTTLSVIPNDRNRSIIQNKRFLLQFTR